MLPIIENKIFTVRGGRVMLDSDLAIVYGVETKNLNRAVERNNRRFPEEFCFRLTSDEWENLKCQIGTSSLWGGRRGLPRVFSEYGVVAAATVLNSERAITASIRVVKAFVQLRRVLDNHTALAEKLACAWMDTIKRWRRYLRKFAKSVLMKPKNRKGELDFGRENSNYELKVTEYKYE